MKISKLRFLICLTVCFAVLLAPYIFGIFLDGKAHAMGFLGGSGDNNNSGGDGVSLSQPASAPPVHHAPEPTTLLLFGAGAVGLVAFRKKFKKK